MLIPIANKCEKPYFICKDGKCRCIVFNYERLGAYLHTWDEYLHLLLISYSNLGMKS
jgi:hypothetical protein